MVRVYAENWQYRRRWYGAESFGHDTGLRDFATQSTDAVARGNCYNDGYYTYETEGYHEAFDGGTTYTGWTRNSASFNCQPPLTGPEARVGGDLQSTAVRRSEGEPD